MKPAIRLRPTPAMVVACLALAIALGGTSYAAIKLPKNSVGAKQLKRNAVTSRKVKSNSITGLHVRESTLAKVPSATNADNATNAANATNATHATTAGSAAPSGAAGGDLAGTYPNPTISPSEAAHEVGAPGEPAFENGWANFPVFAPLSFYKDRLGYVHVQGDVKHDATNGCGTVIFTLPAGYRPATGLGVVAIRQDSGADQEARRVNLNASGTLLLTTGACSALPTAILSLGSVTFKAA